MKKVIFLFLGLSLAACGIKGPPLPPLEEETIQKQIEPQLILPQIQSTDATKAKKKHK